MNVPYLSKINMKRLALILLFRSVLQLFPIFNCDFQKSMFSKDYLHFCLDPMLSNDSASLKLINGDVTSNLIKSGLSSFLLLTLRLCVYFGF